MPEERYCACGEPAAWYCADKSGCDAGLCLQCSVWAKKGYGPEVWFCAAHRLQHGRWRKDMCDAMRREAAAAHIGRANEAAVCSELEVSLTAVRRLAERAKSREAASSARAERTPTSVTAQEARALGRSLYRARGGSKAPFGTLAAVRREVENQTGHAPSYDALQSPEPKRAKTSTAAKRLQKAVEEHGAMSWQQLATHTNTSRQEAEGRCHGLRQAWG